MSCMGRVPRFTWSAHLTPRYPMTTRRSFLKSSALVAASSSIANQKLFGRSHPAATEQETLPPAIAALKSMKDLAKPISRDERRRRIARATELMQQNKLDAILMGGGTSLEYFSNIKWWLSERFFAMILPAKGRPFYVCPAFEHDRAMEQITQGPLDQDPDVRNWQEDENPYALVVQGLKDRGITAGRVGIEERTYFVYS